MLRRRVMPLVFISYAHTEADIALATRLEEWLTAAGIDVWRDRSRIPPGADLDRAIKDAVARCHAAIFLVSQDWLERDWTRKEIALIALRDPSGTKIPRIGVCRAPRSKLDVPAQLWRFLTTDWIDDDETLSDFAHLYEIYCGVFQQSPGMPNTWDENGRRLLGKVAAAPPADLPRRAPRLRPRKERPDEYPSLDCGRSREWIRVQKYYREAQHQVIVIAAAEDEAQDRFVYRIRRKIEEVELPPIKTVDWSPRPLVRIDFLSRLLRGVIDDEEKTVDDLPAALSDLLAESNGIVIHPLLDSRLDDAALVDYYTQWLPEQIDKARPNGYVKCIQPVAWRRPGGVRGFAGTLAAAMRRDVPEWLCTVEERKAKELIGRIAAATAITKEPAPPVFLSAIDGDDVREFCTAEHLGDHREALLQRTRRGERVRTSSDVLYAIDEYVYALRNQPSEGVHP